MRGKGAFATVLCMAFVASAWHFGWQARAEDGCTRTLAPGDDVQRAVDSLPAAGPAATLCLGEGEFRLPTFLAIRRDRLRLRGRGPATRVRLEQGAASPVILVGDYDHRVPQGTITDVAIERLTIVGGGKDGSEVLAEHPYVTNSAIVVRGGRDVALRELDVRDCRSACILTEFGADEVVIEGNEVSGSVWDGISLNRTSHARVVGNRIHDNTAAGITVEHLEDSLIELNDIHDNKTHGIYLSDSYRNTIAANRFAANVLSGVFVTCAVRDRTPVRCWTDSMSRGNLFQWNGLVAERVGYMVGADSAANCTNADFSANLSCGDRFTETPPEQADATYGRCLRYAERCPG